MGTTQLAHSKSRIDKAGVILRRRALGQAVDAAEYAEALLIVNYWRDLHGRCIRSANMGLRSIARSRLRIDRPQVTERHKRIEQIENKLGRESSRLSQMQDIAGVRIVVTTLSEVYIAASHVLRNHAKRLPEGPRARAVDYIRTPKTSGYRCLHVITRYRSYTVEYQIRTEWQNEWANLVETLGGVTGFNIKAGEGPAGLHSHLLILADLLAVIDEGGRDEEVTHQAATTLDDLLSMASNIGLGA